MQDSTEASKLLGQYMIPSDWSDTVEHCLIHIDYGHSLSNTFVFSKNRSHQFLDANILSETKALAGELNAFETDWSWLQETLRKMDIKFRQTVRS
jgi:hypothetical protein